jgi:hypothetical protein
LVQERLRQLDKVAGSMRVIFRLAWLIAIPKARYFFLLRDEL